MKQLILNADDFGMTRGVNEGIIRAHRDGILTSATLMANGPEFDDAVASAKLNPGLGVGCHLVLVAGPAVAPKGKISSLADENGNLPESLGLFVARLTAGLIRTKAIEREMRAQIEKIRAAGIEPTHLDTHKHNHAYPKVMESLARVGKALGITRVRKPMEKSPRLLEEPSCRKSEPCPGTHRRRSRAHRHTVVPGHRPQLRLAHS